MNLKPPQFMAMHQRSGLILRGFFAIKGLPPDDDTIFACFESQYCCIVKCWVGSFPTPGIPRDEPEAARVEAVQLSTTLVLSKMSNLFALPVPITQQPRKRVVTRPKKRKRRAEFGAGKQDDHFTDEDHAPKNEEYTAVVSPDERTQRRQAGISLEQPIPLSPFPHKDTISSKRREFTALGKQADSPSLRIQHISSMTAVLHKSFRDQDWPRARRALGLLLQTEINGQPLDLRNGEYWGLGAEILFRYEPDRGMTWSRRGFENAKEYYEKLIVRFPYHRASSDNINAIDFYLALFSLWIYVTQAERAASSAADDLPDHEAVGREMDEAGLILARITKCMGTAPYADNVDFKKLKADITLWQKNLESEYQVDSPMSTTFQSAENDLSAVAERLSL